MAPKKYPKSSLVVLADWTRSAAYGLKLQKHVFDNALAILKEASHRLESTFTLAAAALLLAVKFEHGPMLVKQKELPLRPAKRQPRVLIS